MKLSRLMWIGALGLCMSLASCHKKDNKLRFAFVTNNASDFWKIARAGCDKAVEEMPDVEVDFHIPDSPTAAAQKQIINDLLVTGVQGIAISPLDPDNATPMLNDVAKKTLLFCQDSDAPHSDRACFVGTNNHDAGKQAGQLIKEALPGGGKIMLFVGDMGAQNAKDRKSGIEEALKGSNVQIIDVRTDNADPTKARTNAQDTLVAYPDVACLVGLYSYDGPAILNAANASPRKGQVKIVCFDEAEETLAGIKAGQIYATVVQQPFEFGHMTITLMAKVVKGDKSVIPASKQIFIPTLAVKKENVEQFQATLNKQLGR